MRDPEAGWLGAKLGLQVPSSGDCCSGPLECSESQQTLRRILLIVEVATSLGFELSQLWLCVETDLLFQLSGD